MDTNTQHSADQSRNTKKNLPIVILALVLAAAVGFGVWYWQQQVVDTQSSRVSNLESEVEALIQEKEQLATPEEGEEDENEEIDTQTVYQAEVGKFTLSLPNEYKVVQKNDGGGEGGASTRLLIAKTTDEAGVYTSSIGNEVTIFAMPLENRNVSYRESVDNRTSNETIIEQNTRTIDGMEAEVYVIGGIGTSKEIYFGNNDMLYEITVSGDTEEANKKLDAVIDGFQSSL